MQKSVKEHHTRGVCLLVKKTRRKMSSGMDLRKRGKRKDPETIATKKQRGRLGDPLNAIDAGSPGEIRISSDSMIAISHLYNSSPSIQAARAILLGQLLGSGVVVRRQGRDVNLKPVFARHLEDVWVPFARQVIDHFLMFGFVLVSLEKESPPPFANFVKGKQLASTSNMAPRGRQGVAKEAPTAAEVRAKAAPSITDDARLDKRINEAKVIGGGNLVPTVPDLGQYEISFVHSGESNYLREYRVFSTNSDSVRSSTAHALTTPLVSRKDAFAIRKRRCTAKTFRRSSSSSRTPTRRATFARPWPPSFSRPRSSRRSRSWRCRPRSCVRGSCS